MRAYQAGSTGLEACSTTVFGGCGPDAGDKAPAWAEALIGHGAPRRARGPRGRGQMLSWLRRAGGRCSSTTPAGCGGSVAGGAAVSGDGAVDCGERFKVVHRACAPARQGGRAGARAAGLLADVAEMTVHLDSAVCEVYGKAKRRRVRPTPACWAITRRWRRHRRVLHRGCGRSLAATATAFARETLARVRRLAADATVTACAGVLSMGSRPYAATTTRQPRSPTPTERRPYSPSRSRCPG